MFGFGISWQYGSIINWMSQFIDVVGHNSAIFTFGCSFGAVSPIIGGYLFRNWYPMAMWHFNLILVICQVIGFLSLKKRVGIEEEKKKDYEYEKLQMEEINLSTSEEDEY